MFFCFVKGSGGKPQKILESFIPEIAANASNLKKLAHIYVARQQEKGLLKHVRGTRNH